MFPRAYNLRENTTLYKWEKLQHVKLYEILCTFIPMLIELRIMDIINSN